MIRRFCDVCDKELTSENAVTEEKTRLTSETHPNAGGLLMFEVITGQNGTWNSGDFCKYCVIDAINKLDDRPRVYAG